MFLPQLVSIKYWCDNCRFYLYLPLTLFLLFLTYLGLVKHFAGAICTHWTTDNTTDRTRVSLDFRLIAGSHFEALKCGGSVDGGQTDVYRQKEGYYSCCRRKRLDDGTYTWERDGPLRTPDARCGFPWTVKDWNKFRKKQGITTS